MSADDSAERLAIRELVNRYFFAIDDRDEALLASCFTAEATAHYHKGFVTEVRLKNGGDIARFLLDRTSVYSATNHVASNMNIARHVDTARVVIHTVATCVVGSQGKVLVRGIRYEDDLVREPDGWRIRHRVHIPQWQYEAAAVTPAIPIKNKAP